MKVHFPSNWQWRRASLGYFVAATSVDRWSALEGVPAEFQSLPVEILQSCQKALIAKRKTQQDVEQYCFYEGFVEEVWSLVDFSSDTEPAIQAADATLAALYQSLSPECEWCGGRYDAQDGPSTQKDAHCLTCAALVGEDVGEPYLAKPSREFWLNWLADLLPKVCSDYDALTEQLRSPPTAHARCQ
jgi:hypothetical protein